jgi:hypothetical protein
MGVVTSEESIRFDLSNNVASLRLLLLESCRNGSAFALHNHIKLVIWPKPKPILSTEPIMVEDEGETKDEHANIRHILIDLSFAMNSKCFFDLCRENISSSITVQDLENRIYLVRTGVPDASAK